MKAQTFAAIVWVLISLIAVCNAGNCAKLSFWDWLLRLFVYPKHVDETKLTVTDMICHHGYPVETYEVLTEDGFILTIHRIPHGKNGRSGFWRKPVILQHGILCSSASWVINTHDKNFAYILADQGYDVWLTNVRGNEYGLKHIALKSTNEEFWHFSWDEMASYDMPALIDFILMKTYFNKVMFIGHSMGTTIMFAMLASKQEYNKKVVGVMAMAPVAYVYSMRTPLRFLTSYAKDIAHGMTTLFGKGQFFVNPKFRNQLASIVCKHERICTNMLFIICGWNEAQFNVTRLPVYFRFTPSGTSMRTIMHFVQEYQSGKFRHYDFGAPINRRVYRQSEPPDYNIKAITALVALFWSDNDLLADREDVARLSVELPNLFVKYRVPQPSFSHLDFMWAIDSKALLYNAVMATMNALPWN